jgi:anti-sigma factor (TIGR02949 family)
MGKAGRTVPVLSQRFRHCRLTGGIRPQAIDSFMPCAMGPQAAVWASRVASASEAADAVAVFRLLLKATVTVHSTRWEERVDQSRKPPKASSTRSVSSLPRLVTRSSRWVPGGHGTRRWVPLFSWERPGRRTNYTSRDDRMDCDAVLVLLWEYLDEELGSEEAEAVGTHLGRCPRCHPAYCCDRAFLDLLARQRSRCSAPSTLVVSVHTRLRLT